MGSTSTSAVVGLSTPNIDPLNRGSILTGTQRLGRQRERQVRKVQRGRNRKDPITRKLSSDLKYSNSTQNYSDKIKNRKIQNENNGGNEDRRKLRLKWSEKSFFEKNKNQILDFIPEVHTKSTKKRLNQYHAVYEIIPVKLRKELDVINKKLKIYGYSLDKGVENWYRKSQTVFDFWSIRNLN